MKKLFKTFTLRIIEILIYVLFYFAVFENNIYAARLYISYTWFSFFLYSGVFVVLLLTYLLVTNKEKRKEISVGLKEKLKNDSYLKSKIWRPITRIISVVIICLLIMHGWWVTAAVSLINFLLFFPIIGMSKLIVKEFENELT